jgi:eukaryotic-like serine/threonine-protein kinase
MPIRAFAAAQLPDIQPHEGLRVGRYELLVPIAQGGMAEVWIARLVGDLGFQRIVALKTIRPEYAQDPSFRRSFFEEARIAARVSHANVVDVLDLGEEGPILFQVMRLIEGDSIAKLLRHRHERLGKPAELSGLPVQIAVRIMIDALAGLHAAHEITDDDGVAMQLVHRDVTPHNILVGIDGVARLADFGVAKALGRLVDETDAGQLRGKPGYFAPEQIARRPLDRRTDVFAAGIVLWEAITGKHLFRTEEMRPAQSSIDAETYPEPRTAAEPVPPPISEVVMRALSKRPEDRYATAAEMSLALEQAARASGGPAAASQVADLVVDLSGHRVMMQRSLVRRATKTTAVDVRALEDPKVSDSDVAKTQDANIAAHLRQLASPAQLTPAPAAAANPRPKRPDTTTITDFIHVPIIRPKKPQGIQPYTILKIGFALVSAVLLTLFLKRFVFSPARVPVESGRVVEPQEALSTLPQDHGLALPPAQTSSAARGAPRTSPSEHKKPIGRPRSRGRTRTR